MTTEGLDDLPSDQIMQPYNFVVSSRDDVILSF